VRGQIISSFGSESWKKAEKTLGESQENGEKKRCETEGKWGKEES